MDQKAISVSQLSGYIKGIFDAEELLHNISVYGEISGLSILRGNAYFTLKDENALLSCVFFGVNNEDSFKNGDLIVATGTPRYYVKGGKLNFNVVSVRPYGIGELFGRFMETKNKLEKEGLFDKQFKKQIPSKIKRIGVVSSEKGAVIRDIINVSSRRDKSVDIVLFPSRVQGEGAEKDLIAGVKYFNENSDVDVIIVARGGGSFEDLMPFNDENLARAVFESKKPVVSAVGHETDFTIIDFVADLRAPTPSAAAELVVSPKEQKVEKLLSLISKMSAIVEQKMNLAYSNVSIIRKDLENSIKSLINEIVYNFEMKVQALEKLNPARVLERGYAKIERNLENITSINQIKIEDNLEIHLKDGKINAIVKDLEGK